MRVTYNRELKVKKRLDELGIENFIPMCYQIVLCGGDRQRKYVPAIHNLIFVHTTQEHLTYLKYNDEVLAPLRYMMRNPLTDDTPAEVIVVPDRQMNNFIRACRMGDEGQIRYLRYDPYLDKPGQRVRIIDGNFAGIEGIVKRINKNKQVVVMIPGVAAVTLSSVPHTFLEKI